MWRCIDDSLPSTPGTYSIRLFSESERKAYWTGKEWRAAKQNKKLKSVKYRGDFHLLRYWDDGINLH